MQARTREIFPAVDKFSAATPEQQDEILHRWTNRSKRKSIRRPFRPRPAAKTFFETVRMHTIVAFLLDPDAGGNPNGVGWTVIGREREHMFQPPFGYYDKDYPAGSLLRARTRPSHDDPEQPKYKTSDEVDFVVVGSGAAGGIVAKELSENGFRVVVLEQGPYLTEADFTHNEIKVLNEDLLTNHPKLQPNTFRKTPDEKAKPQRALVYGRLVGGTSVHFTANFWRFHEIDFIERSKVGPISGTGFTDWPISYADLEPYYTKVEWEIGVSGLAGASPFDPPRSKPYPMPPLPTKSSGVIFERAARKLGWNPFPAPMAILSQPRPGRSACINCGFCLAFGCEVGAKSSSLATAIRMAEKTGRCEIRPNSYVHRIELDANGRATGAVYFDEKRNVQLQKAKAVVVSANGAETPRLLLLSANKQFPNGLANSSGLVGKYLMFNSGAIAVGVFEQPLNDYKGFAVSRILHDFYETGSAKGWLLRRRRARRALRYNADRFCDWRAAAGYPALGQGLQGCASAQFHAHHGTDVATALRFPWKRTVFRSIRN